MSTGPLSIGKEVGRQSTPGNKKMIKSDLMSQNVEKTHICPTENDVITPPSLRLFASLQPFSRSHYSLISKSDEACI